jgi:hypothetical protein
MIGVLLLITSCVPEPIEWDTPRAVPDTLRATTSLTINADGSPRLVEERVPSLTLPSGACGASLVATRGRSGEWYAAWFVPRPNSGVALAVAHSTDDGATWGAPVIVDDRDRGRRGCQRPPPALVASAVSDYVHVAYYLEPPQGAGVWYTHSMDRGHVWHQTIGVLYGDAPARTSVASAGDTVIVAYEHPGAPGRRLGLAISRQAGHTFDAHLRVVHGSSWVGNPRVAIQRGVVALAWSERPAEPSSRAVRLTRLMKGRLR